MYAKFTRTLVIGQEEFGGVFRKFSHAEITENAEGKLFCSNEIELLEDDFGRTIKNDADVIFLWEITVDYFSISACSAVSA